MPGVSGASTQVWEDSGAAMGSRYSLGNTATQRIGGPMITPSSFLLKDIIFGEQSLGWRTPTPLVWRMYPRHCLPWHLSRAESRCCSAGLTGPAGRCPCGTVSHATVTTQTHRWTPGLPVSQWKLEHLHAGKPGLCRVAQMPPLLIPHPN